MTLPQARLKIKEAQAELDRLYNEIEDLKTNFATCSICGVLQPKDKYYKSTDPLNKSGVTPICKKCAQNLAIKYDSEGNRYSTKSDVRTTMSYLNKPFLDSVWEASVREASSGFSGKKKATVYDSYIKNISMINYQCMTYRDSDFSVGVDTETSNRDTSSSNASPVFNDDVLNSFRQNKRDVVRLLGYDPFEKESLADQPYLYSSLIGYLDASEDANEDRLKVASSIEIVKDFNHIEKINDVITTLMMDVYNMEKNVSTIKNLEDTKTKITSSILGLAKDNGISLKHSVNSSKGENTWTGKVRKLKELNLKELETNLYDVEYSKGLQQVAEISNAAIIKQIRLDENDYNDMIIQQRNLINKYKQQSDDSEEKARLLLKENCDLKEFAKRNGLDINRLDGDNLYEDDLSENNSEDNLDADDSSNENGGGDV